MGMMACHSCRRQCCNPRHLDWGPPSKNFGEDKCRDGTANVGERHGNAKLSEVDVRQIRMLCSNGELTQAEVSVRFGVDPSTISGIHRHRAWTHIP
jgi:hypothetical protein